MKKLITLFAIAGMVLALAPAAQAAIIPTGDIADWGKTVDGVTGNWSAITGTGGRGAGTLDISGGNIVDAISAGGVLMGQSNGSAGTLTVTGPGSKYLGADLTVGNYGGDGTVNVTSGGSVETANFQMGSNGSSDVLVTGAGSYLSATTRLQVGRQGTPSVTLTVADGGLVQTALLQFGEGGEFTVGNVHMAVGGILAVSGNKTANPFVNGGLFTFSGTPTSEIQYDAGSGYVNMTGATEGADYTLTYYNSSTFINGVDVNGYTVLTMLVPPTPGTLIYGK